MHSAVPQTLVLRDMSIQDNNPYTLRKAVGSCATIHKMHDFWYSPDQKYAVAQFNSEVLAVLAIESITADTVTASCLKRMCFSVSDEDFLIFSVRWYMAYGFLKICADSMEYGCLGTLRRFYFDPELYKRAYQEVNGVPYTGNKAF